MKIKKESLVALQIQVGQIMEAMYKDRGLVLIDEITKAIELCETTARVFGYKKNILPIVRMTPPDIDVVICDIVSNIDTLIEDDDAVIQKLREVVSSLLKLFSPPVCRGYAVLCRTADEALEAERIAEGRQKKSIVKAVLNNVSILHELGFPCDEIDKYAFVTFDAGRDHNFRNVFMFSWHMAHSNGKDLIKIMSEIIADKKLLPYDSFVAKVKEEELSGKLDMALRYAACMYASEHSISDDIVIEETDNNIYEIQKCIKVGEMYFYGCVSRSTGEIEVGAGDVSQYTEDELDKLTSAVGGIDEVRRDYGDKWKQIAIEIGFEIGGLK